jgi:hypothetical protein
MDIIIEKVPIYRGYDHVPQVLLHISYVLRVETKYLFWRKAVLQY